MKKTVLLVFISAFITGAVFANGSGDVKTEENDSKEKVVLNYYAWTEGDYLQKIIDKYNSTSSIATVELVSIPSEDYDKKLTTMLSGKNDIDLYNMRSISLLNMLAESGNLLDLTEYIKDSGFDITAYGSSFAETSIDNNFFALPYRSQSYALFYNKKIFDNKQLPYPDNLTWEEYAELSKQLTSGEGGDKAYGGFIPDWLYAPFMTQQLNSNIADDDLYPTQVWLEMLNRLYNTDNSHMSFQDMKSTGVDYINYFCTGKCAMLPNGEWCVGEVKKFIKNNPDVADSFELGIAILPQIEKNEKPITLGGVSTFIGINSTTEKAAAAYDFALYFAGEESAIEISNYGMIPAYTSEKTIESYNNSLDISGAENLLNIDKVFEGLFFPEFTELQNVYQEEKEMYLIGEQSIQETIKNYEELRNSIMNN